mmetsp:Transcript_11861/g.10110  ORF Transcript_11861/g.10110 Transcript_11861/m.10110 type:complete len:142 (-) Transcript_11861:135-560(-)
MDSLQLVECWGYNSYGQTNPPAGSPVSLAAGSFHSCGIFEYTNTCWGNNSHGQTNAPLQQEHILITAGERHSCILNLHAYVHCWGSDLSGQATLPPQVKYIGVVGISSGFAHNCALNLKNILICWGNNDYGQASVPQIVNM